MNPELDTNINEFRRKSTVLVVHLLNPRNGLDPLVVTTLQTNNHLVSTNNFTYADIHFAWGSCHQVIKHLGLRHRCTTADVTLNKEYDLLKRVRPLWHSENSSYW